MTLGYSRGILSAVDKRIARKVTTMSNSWISKGARQWLYTRDQLICCYCGMTCHIGNTRTDSDLGSCATLDHIVPQKDLAESATNDKHFFALRPDPKNLVTVCMKCNSSKQHTSLYVWCKQTNRDYAAHIKEISRRIVIERKV